MTASHVRKILAALIGSPLILGLSSLPDPWGKIAAGAVALVGLYVNWGRATPTAAPIA